MVAWVNLHGSFVLGGVLISLVFVGEMVGIVLWPRAGTGETRAMRRTAAAASLKPLFAWGAVTAAAMLVNPQGPRVFEYVFGLIGNPAIQGIVEEWQAPVFGSIVGNLFFAYAALVVATAILARSRPDAVDLMTLAAFFWLALGGERHVIWFALVSLPVLAKQAASLSGARSGRRRRQGRRGVNLAFLATMTVAIFLVLPPVKQHLSLPAELAPLVSADTPVKTVEFLRSDEPRPHRLFHSETTGSYLMWAAPEQRVFVDARVQLYTPQLLNDYMQLSAGVEPDSLLAVYAIDGLLLDTERQSDLLTWAQESADWEVRFEETCCSYLVRRRAP
jgi:hypothetical protein